MAYNQHETVRQNRSRRWLTVQVLFLLPLMSLTIRLLGFKRSYIGLGRLAAIRARNRGVSQTSLESAQGIAEIVTVANRRYSFYQGSCLSESLVLWWLLRSHGIASEFCLGVRTLTGPFESHTWVEYDGFVLNDISNIGQIYERFDLSALSPGIKLP